MFDLIRKNKFSKIIACYLAFQLIGTIVAPTAAYALTSGPSQPEFNSFTPIGTSDMVNLASGDFNYNIPIMDVGGYPLNLAYDSGITMDQEASWVGLGWNLNVGQITRNVRGLPDDFDGDAMHYENNRKDDVTVGVGGSVQFPVLGFPFLDLGTSLSVQNNSYSGISANVSLGPSFDISDRVTVGFQFGGTSSGGASVSPTVSVKSKDKEDVEKSIQSIGGNLGVTYDSQKGLSSFNISASTKYLYLKNNAKEQTTNLERGASSFGGSFTMNDYLTFTPKNELSFNNTNLSFSFGLGTELIATEGPQPQVKAWGSYQNLPESEKSKELPAYGYENTEKANSDTGILDFNREKDRIITENTNALAPTNYTYDTYQILGQGFQGSFRAHRNKVGNVYDNKISSTGIGASFGGEAGGGSYAHIGLDVEVNPSSSETGVWLLGNDAIRNLGNSSQSNDLKAEKFHYKMGGDWSSDKEYEDNTFNYFGDKAIRVDISSGNSTEYQRRARSRYKVKNYNANGSVQYETQPLRQIERTTRESRNTNIRKVTNREAQEEGLILHRDESFVKNHHTAGYIALKDDGSRYVYGETAYNTKKVEATFNVGGTADCSTGLIKYTPREATIRNESGRDDFFNKVTTPAYAHSFLLTSVLSSDYEDLTNDGPSIDDLGSYTKISYENPSQYNWRVPLVAEDRMASYNGGLNTDVLDQKGNYIYGEKELKYVQSIETKTHIAIFHLSSRKDSYGAQGETGKISNTSMKKIDKIELFNRSEYYNNDLVDAVPIKVAHFEYDYEMAPGIPNNKGEQTLVGNESANQGGKLTLKKVYFTYRNSNMGYYTPYTFDYVEEALNPEYNLKGYDVWGSYKENEASSSCNVHQGEMTPSEFPFTTQNKTLADNNVKSWSLQSINLPSGGKLSVDLESDDYGFVQDKKAMQMFKVVGAGNSSNPSGSSINKTDLYDGSDFSKYLYVKLPQDLIIDDEYTNEDFYNDFLKNNYSNEGDVGMSRNNLMYYRFLVNMTQGTNTNNYDYVTGYVELEEDNINLFADGADNYVALPLVFQDKEGGIFGSNEQVNPIAKSGWYFGRRYLNRQVYGLNAGDNSGGFEDVIRSLETSISSIATIFGGPNQSLKAKGIARKFIGNKSWVRLYEPSGSKYGGGVRVSKIELDDQWDIMTGNNDNDRYYEKYGQEYSYINENGKSSGVATFEPNASKENPFVLPIFDDPVKIIAPMESNYIEKPLGESFFPAAQVTYGRVVVKNLDKSILDDNNTVTRSLKKHATGEVITEYYTSKDFPTIVDYTDPQIEFDKTGLIGDFLKVKTRNHIALSQGIVVHTNDMNGKMKSQRVKSETQGEGEYISGVDYKYSVDSNGKLQNVLPVIDKDGVAKRELVAVNYDMINDFRYSRSISQVLGVDGNIGILPLLFGLPTPVPTILPNYNEHQDVLKMAMTTKVVQTQGILKEKVAYDLGSQVSTTNLAWDANTGQTLLTEVDNEYSDKYYNFTYPAYWYYKGMSSASENLGVVGILQSGYSDGEGDEESLFTLVNQTNQNAEDIFKVGDELTVRWLKIGGGIFGTESSLETTRLWVSDIIGNQIRLMDRDGMMINQSCADSDLVINASTMFFKIVRSGYRNQQMASMASITTQENPIDINGDGVLNSLMPDSFEYSTTTNGKKVVNASAVLYKEHWKPQFEMGLPRFPTSVMNTFEEANNGNHSPDISPENYGFNPYLYNVRSEWRAVKSYAFLTGRDNGEDITTNVSTRDQGFFNQFAPFYTLNGSSDWEIGDNLNQWTFASQVSQYSPYGAELENKDALDRFSSAQYGYNYTLPTAVASNSTYAQMGYDGFEDYDYNINNGIITSTFQRPHFGVYSPNNGALTEDESHSGRYSLKVSGGDEAVLSANLQIGDYEVTQPECVDDVPPPIGGQDEVIGDTESCDGSGGNLTFHLYGTAGETFRFGFSLDRGNAEECASFSTTISTTTSTTTYVNPALNISFEYDNDGYRRIDVSYTMNGDGDPAIYTYSKDFVDIATGEMCDDVKCENNIPADEGGF